MTSPDSTPKAREKYKQFLESRKNNGHFIDSIKEIREKYNIPLNGVKDDTVGGRDFYKHVQLDDDVYFDFEDDITKLAEKHDMKSDWLLVRNYVVFNDFLDDEESEALVQNIDFAKMTEGFSDIDTLDKLKFFGRTDPIMISISPMASRNDIINHVKETYTSQIKILQEKHKTGNEILGTISNRDPEKAEMYLFIYENKHLSAKEIASLVSKKYNKFYDYTYITKIINQMSRP